MFENIKNLFSEIVHPSFHQILMDSDNYDLINKSTNAIVYGSTATAGSGVIFGLSPDILVSVGFLVVAVGTALFNAWFKMKYQRDTKDKK